MSYTKKKSKIKYIFFLISSVLVVSLFVIMKVRGNADGYRTISIVEVSGNVSVVKNGIEYVAYEGIRLGEGHEIVTAGNSYVRLILDGDKYVKLEAGSKLTFEKLGLLGSGKTRMKLDRGSITAELTAPLGKNEEFVVNVPNAVLAVRGTFFRIDISSGKEGNIVADVVTYGGAVASQRVLPTGDIVEEEVIVEAGFKTCINMNSDKTVYVVDDIETEEVKEDSVISSPIQIADIPDDDIVDIFFSVQNGHELFVTEEEAKTHIEEREIVIEEYIPVYEKAEVVMEAEEIKSNKIASAEIYANDAKPIEIAPEEVKKEESTEKNNTSQVILGIPVNDGVGTEKPKPQPEPHTHKYDEVILMEATCTEDGEKQYSCECGDEYIEEIAATGHTEINGKKADSHIECETCGTVLEDGTAHSYTSEVTLEPTCTEVGERTYTCNCGYTYTEDIEATGHTEINGKKADSHIECETCGTVLEDGTAHSYTSEVTLEPTCTEKGERTYTCECGYSYTEAIEENGHTEINGKKADSHIECETCGTVLEDGTAHSYTSEVTLEPTCTEVGERTHTCGCGYVYTEEIPANGHTKADEGADITTCTVCNAELIEINANVFTDSAFRDYISQTLDVEGDGFLSDDEIASITAIDISGTETLDGGCTDLTGIEYFTELTSLTCDYNSGITGFDLSQNTKLESLSLVGCTSITTLDISAYTTLTYLNVSGTSIESLDVAANTALVTLIAKDCPALLTVNSSVSAQNTNALTNVELTGCTSLTTLNLNNCSNISSIDVSTLTALTDLNLSGTGITTFSGRTDVIDLSSNPNLTTFRITYTDIGAIDFSGSPLLQTVVCSFATNITEVDLSNHSNLKALTLSNDTSLASLNIDGCTNLQTLIVVDSSLTSLELTQYPNIRLLNVLDNTKLTSYTVSGCASLTSLNLRGNTALETLVIDNCGVKFTNLASQCTELKTLQVTRCASMTTLSINELTKLTSVDLTDTDGITSFSVTNAGSANETGSLVFTTTAVDTYDTSTITGWDSTIMSITPSS